MRNNRIEEVKKILGFLELSNLVEIAHWFGHIDGDEAGLHRVDIACEICQLFPQPLDDKESREALAEALNWYSQSNPYVDWHRKDLSEEDKETKERWRNIANDIYSALLQPKIEALKAEIEALRRERIGEVWYWQGDGEDKLESLTCPVLIEALELKGLIGEAKREERGRIIDKVEKYFREYDCYAAQALRNSMSWQALQGGEWPINGDTAMV